MKRQLVLIFVTVLIAGIVTSPADAQKGIGDSTGVAQQMIKPEVLTFSGTITAVLTEPCKMTTGPSVEGTHLLLEMADGTQRNLHLGPTVSVERLTDPLVVGKEVTVQAFRTDKLPQDNYVAQIVTVDDQVIRFRDENLRPVWAGSLAIRQGRGSWARGMGMNYQRGPGQGRGAAMGQGRGGGRGQGLGQGRGQGRGQGLGCGQGFGRGFRL